MFLIAHKLNNHKAQSQGLQCNQKTQGRLGMSHLGGKRTAIKHLVRCQLGEEWSASFDNKVSLLWKGLRRINTNNKHREDIKKHKRLAKEAKRKAGEVVSDDGGSDSDESLDDGDDRYEFLQGKSPMTTELYRSILKWFLELGTLEGLFCACYVAMTWHLACRSNNTGRIKFSHMSHQYFDGMHVRFRHTKTQQLGEAKSHSRALYANPFYWFLDLPLIMALYLAKGFNSPQSVGERLFPGGGEAQSERVSDNLKRLLQEHEAEVLAMGYNSLDEIGLHSIRKGVSTHLSSLPGGPPPAAICLRGNWSMGQVKDIYFHQTQGGDEFCGRCSALLNMYNGEIASTGAFFKDSADRGAIKSAVDQVFPAFTGCEGMGRTLERCLAAMVYHNEAIQGLEADHEARSINLYQQAEMLAGLKDHVAIVKSWDTKEQLTGIPPHIKSLVDIATIKTEQSKLVEEVYKKVTKGMEDSLQLQLTMATSALSKINNNQPQQ